MINEYDVNGNGSIEFDEFIILMSCESKENDTEEEIRDVLHQQLIYLCVN